MGVFSSWVTFIKNSDLTSLIFKICAISVPSVSAISLILLDKSAISSAPLTCDLVDQSPVLIFSATLAILRIGEVTQRSTKKVKKTNTIETRNMILY